MGKSLGIHPYRGEIPAEQIVRGMEVIDRNSREILDDAKLLLENGRYARALSLSVVALEESVKKSLLLALYAVQANGKLRKELWQAYRSHTLKASYLVRRAAVRGAFEGQNIEEKAQRMGKILDVYKQLGLYSDSYETDEGHKSWFIPSKSVTPDMAKIVFEMISKDVGGAGDEAKEEKIRKFRWRVIQAMDEYPQDQALERMRAMGRTTVSAARDFSEDDGEFANRLENLIRLLLEEEDTPSEET
jgi:AbiV family abortive infection protein